MDDLVSNLANSFQSTQLSKQPDNPLSTTKQHPRFDQFKQKTILDQDERRKRFLDVQKQSRFDYLNHVRRLTEDDWEEFSGSDDEDGVRNHGNRKQQHHRQPFGRGTGHLTADRGDDTMDMEVQFQRPGRRYKNQLMLSEWLVEIPLDFEQEWQMVMCPVGKRSLVIAARGTTTVYSRSGILVNQFESHLPGGRSRNSGKYQNTILDCIYSDVHRTYFVLDIMTWASYSVMDTETEFRFFWLNSKLQESPILSTFSTSNPYLFVPLPQYDCNRETISSAMIVPQAFEVDGLLFFHKRTHYTFGSTPLVVWLKPYMVPDVLDVPILDYYMEKMPQNYTNYEQHIALVKKNKELSQSRKHGSPKARTPQPAHNNPPPGGAENRLEVASSGWQPKKFTKNKMDFGFLQNQPGGSNRMSTPGGAKDKREATSYGRQHTYPQSKMDLTFSQSQPGGSAKNYSPGGAESNMEVTQAKNQDLQTHKFVPNLMEMNFSQNFGSPGQWKFTPVGATGSPGSQPQDLSTKKKNKNKSRTRSRENSAKINEEFSLQPASDIRLQPSQGADKTIQDIELRAQTLAAMLQPTHAPGAYPRGEPVESAQPSVSASQDTCGFTVIRGTGAGKVTSVAPLHKPSPGGYSKPMDLSINKKM